MALTPPPTAPYPGMNQAQFDAAAYNLVSWHGTNVAELGALQADVAARQADVAANQALAAASAAVKNTDQYKGLWSSGATYTVGQSVKYNGGYWLANRTSTAVTPVEGADWASTTVSVNTLPITVNAANVTFATTPGGGGVNAVVALGTQYELVIVSGSSAAHAVVWDKTNKVFGAPALIRSASLNAYYYLSAVAISGAQAIVMSVPSGSTALEAVSVSISGTTITVGTAATATLASAFDEMRPAVLVGTSIVLPYIRGGYTVNAIRALSVSGSTVTIGAETALSGTGSEIQVYAASSTVALALSVSGTLFYAQPYTVSGSTLTLGTGASTACNNTSYLRSCALTTGRWAASWVNGTAYGGVVNVTGAVATISVAGSMGAGTSYPLDLWPVAGGRALLLMAAAIGFNVLTDNAGTAVAGTLFSSNAFATPGTVPVHTSTSTILHSSAGVYRFTSNGNDPLVTPIGFAPIASNGNYTYGGIASTKGARGAELSVGSRSIGISNAAAASVFYEYTDTTVTSYASTVGIGASFGAWFTHTSDAVSWGLVPQNYTNGTIYRLARAEMT